MSTTPIVEYDKFATLGGLDLCHYMEPLIVNPTTTIASDELDRMLVELPKYDDYHLVYAIELGSKHSPGTFAQHLPTYLAHEQGSVWSAALRNLEQLPNQYVTQDLVDSVSEVLSSNPQKEWIAELIGALEKRLAEKQG